MDDTAYRRNLPCLNPNCKSHGKPHPNCRCYGFAEGGEVGHFCSECRDHKPDCEYFSNGGVTGSDFVPDNQFVPDQNSDFVPDNKFVPDSQPQAAGQDFVPDDQFVPDNQSPLEQLKAGAEGIGQGILGPLAPMAEVASGLTTKDNIARRAQDFPVTHAVGEGAGFVAGAVGDFGLPWAAGKLAGGLSEAANLGKIGSAVFKAAVETSSFAGSDELTKAFLGQPGSDPEHPVSAALLHVGAAGLLGGLTGGAFTLGEGIIGKGLESLETPEGQEKLNQLVEKMGQSKTPLKDLGVDRIIKKYAHGAADATAAAAATGIKKAIPLVPWFVPFEAIQTRLIPYADAFAGKISNKLAPYAADALAAAINKNEISGASNAVHYAIQGGKGLQKGIAGVGACFKAGSAQIAPPVSDQAKNKVDEFIKGGQVNTQLQNTMQDQAQGNNFAQGGEVKGAPNSAFANIFPEQNQLLNTAKGRISGYLNSIRPLNNQPKMAFDSEPPMADKKRQYDKALEFAASPLSILNHVNKGDLTPEHMAHFTSMYPEVHRFLSKEMTKQITEAQLKNEKPPYNKRQSMSLFLGADLDSSFSPQAVQTIQALYANKQAAQQQQVPTKNKKGTSSLSKAANSSLTADQAREQRQQNQKA